MTSKQLPADFMQQNKYFATSIGEDRISGNTIIDHKVSLPYLTWNVLGSHDNFDFYRIWFPFFFFALTTKKLRHIFSIKILTYCQDKASKTCTLFYLFLIFACSIAALLHIDPKG